MIKRIRLSHDSDEVRIYVEVSPVDGISSTSDLEIVINNEGIVADLWENTERSLQSAECTMTFNNTFDEFVELLK